jgi:hypothetical protein
VRDDQMIAPTASLLSVDFMLQVLKTAGCTREAAMAAITATAGEYLVDWTGSDADKKAAKKARKAATAEFDADGKIAAIFDDFKAGLPKIPRAGSVKFEGIVEEVVVVAGEIREAV